MPGGLSIAPTVQAIVVDCVAVVNPKFAPIIRIDAEVVTPCLEDSQAASPTDSKVIAASKTRPLATGVTIVYILVTHLKPSQAMAAIQ